MHHLKNLRYLLLHKYYVFLAGLELGVPIWQLVIHDWSKLTPTEWGPYARTFFGPKPPTQDKAGYKHQPGSNPEFDKAWEHHWRNNPHHWQYWLQDGEPLEMPEKFAREMVADWRGAGMVQRAPDTRAWYLKNRDTIILHSETRQFVEYLLKINQEATCA